MKSFDCGDADLNDFLLNDAKIANTYILEDKGCIVAYYSLLNDKVSKMDATNSAWKRVKKLFPHSKQFSSYPSVKIGRFAVALSYEGKGIGKKLICLLFAFMNTFLEVHFREQPYQQVDC